MVDERTEKLNAQMEALKKLLDSEGWEIVAANLRNRVQLCSNHIKRRESGAELLGLYAVERSVCEDILSLPGGILAVMQANAKAEISKKLDAERKAR